MTSTRMRVTHVAIPLSCLLMAGLGSVPAAAVAGNTPAGPQTVADAQWTLAAVGAHRAWRTSRGEGVTVAVLDTGVDAAHPDLRGQVRGGGDFGDGSSGTGLHDAAPSEGHGTEVASMVAATGRNYHGDGLMGVAPKAHVLSLGVYRNGRADPSAVEEASRTAVSRGADILVVPAAGFTREVLGIARRADAVVVTGSGSHTSRIDLGATPGAVAAVPVDRHGVAPAGTRGYHGAALAAPGEAVLGASSSGSYWTGDDPVFAAAAVAGAAALLRAAHPGLTASEVVGLLVDTAQPASSRCGATCGAGLLRADRALAAESPAQPSFDQASRRDPVWGMALVAMVVLLVAAAAAASTAWWRLRDRRPGGLREDRR